MVIADFRSDTVTKPTAAMRQAMAAAEVGDDVFGEDPTVRRLEERSAELTGKPAAVFVPTGTMGNQISIYSHCQPGHEIIADQRSHIVLYEMGGTAVVSGCITRTVSTSDGLLSWGDIAPLVRKGSDHYRGTGLITVEDTHNIAGGRVYPLARLAEIHEQAHAHGVPVHMDGARLFNAAAALEVPVSAITQYAESVSFCLSKGLGAPVGSIVAGPEDFIQEARLARKMMGGGMRQVGVLAAASLVAFDDIVPKLREDHANARWIAETLAGEPGISIDPNIVETNILFLEISAGSVAADRIVEAMAAEGILALALSGRIRMVTHHQVSRADCERAVAVIRRVAA